MNKKGMIMLELISFFTRVPFGKTSLEKAAKHSFLLPVLGGLIGLMAGAFGLVVFVFMDNSLAALFTVACLYSITGLNHLDGVSDFADGLYTCGSSERKIKSMKDTQMGVAGVAMIVFIILFFIFAVIVIKGNIYKIIVAEICAKTAMLCAIFIGKSMEGGMGRIFIENINKRAFPISIFFAFAFSFVLLQYWGMIAVLASIVLSLIIVRIAHKNFDGINGDVIGAINELSRVVALSVLLIKI